jgi:hypothetical protein
MWAVAIKKKGRGVFRRWGDKISSEKLSSSKTRVFQHALYTYVHTYVNMDDKKDL